MTQKLKKKRDDTKKQFEIDGVNEYEPLRNRLKRKDTYNTNQKNTSSKKNE